MSYYQEGKPPVGVPPQQGYGAGYPPQGYPPQGYPQGYEQQQGGYPPQGYPQGGYPPQYPQQQGPMYAPQYQQQRPQGGPSCMEACLGLLCCCCLCELFF